MIKLSYIGATLMLATLTTTSFAQSSGEADPAQAKAPAVGKTSATQRTDARAQRKVAGRAAARGAQPGEGQSEPTPTAVVSRADRKSADAKRSAANREINKAGGFARGGSHDAPENVKR